MTRNDDDDKPPTGRRGRPPGLLVDGEFLLARRNELGLTRDQLAELAGVDAKTIQRCEPQKGRGHSHRASRDTLERLAGALGVSLHELILSPAVETQRRLEQFFLAPRLPPEPWVGRTREAERVIACITATRPCCVAGPAGIGKTALARFVAREVAARFPHGIVWIKASHQGRPVDIEETQLRMAEALDFQHRLPPVQQAQGVARQRAFTRILWSQRRLIILDEVMSPDLVAQLSPQDHGAALLVTTHLAHVAEQFDDAIELGGLSLADTETILAHHIGKRRVERDHKGVQELHAALAGQPRSIYIAAGILKRERLVEIGEYATRMRKNPADGHYSWMLRTAENSLLESFSQVQKHVSPAAWSLLGRLSLFDNAPFSLAWAAVAGALASTDAVKKPLSELIDVSLVEDADTTAQGPRANATSRGFRLRAHVPLLARTILGDRRAAVFEQVARHAVDTARQTSARDDYTAIAAERELWAHVLDTLVAFVVDADAVRDWDGCSPFSETILPSFGNAYLVDTVTLLLPYLQHENLPQLGTWLRSAIACARAMNRIMDEGRLLLALGRFWLRVHVDMSRAIECFDAATERFVDSRAPALASVALSEAGRALLGSMRHAEGMERFEGALGHARAGHDSGPELACRINNAAASFTRQPGLEAWRRAAALLEDAVAACPGADPASTLLRVVCTLNLASVRQVLTNAGDSTTRERNAAGEAAIDEATRNWRALDVDAPLFEARMLLVRAVLVGDRADGGGARAVTLWHEQLKDTPLADQDLLWLIGEAAFHSKLYLRSKELPASALPPNVAQGLALSDVSREIRLRGGDFVPLGLLFPVAPLVKVFDAGFLASAKAWADDIYGPGNRVSTELAELEALLDHSPLGEPAQA
jgi:transcriptional regulator with XRE-family HTH domain